MKHVKIIGGYIYAYCTDFIINLADLTGLSYYEINAIIFCIVWPTLTLLLFILNIYETIKHLKS